MPDKVLKMSRRYLPPFLSYRENMRGVIFTPPPPAVRGLNVRSDASSGRGPLASVIPLTFPGIPRLLLKYPKNSITHLEMHQALKIDILHRHSCKIRDLNAENDLRRARNRKDEIFFHNRQSFINMFEIPFHNQPCPLPMHSVLDPERPGSHHKYHLKSF